MKTILFLTQRIPFPPNKGDKLRAYRILKHWAKQHKVFLGCLVDDPEDWRHTGLLDGLCAGTFFAKLEPKIALMRAAGAFISNEPLSVPYYRDTGLAGWVRGIMDDERPDCLFLFSSVMAQYVPGESRRLPRMLMDFVDVDSEKWAEYAATKRFPARLIYRREARQLLRFDRAVAGRADASIFVSEPEAELFRKRAPEIQTRVHVVPNGIDADYFSPDAVGARVERTGAPALTFTGRMDYWPNVDAVRWFSDEVLPRLRAKYPDAHFTIVGAHPSKSVMALSERPGVSVTGTVDDVRPYIAGADAVVAPMRISRGVQNKVLEGMAMARPVVVTPQALEGIDAEPGVEVLLARDANEFLIAIEKALQSETAHRLGAAARSRILRAYSWERSLDRYDRLLAG